MVQLRTFATQVLKWFCSSSKPAILLLVCGFLSTIYLIYSPSNYSTEDTNQWPSLDIFLPLAGDKITEREFRDIFLKTFGTFWPIKQSNVMLLMLLDNEVQTSTFQQTIQRAINDLFSEMHHRFAYNSFPADYKVGGHDRQQWLMFWADNFTSKSTEFVGFLDSDTSFISRVTKYDIFDEKNRPIVRPLYGEPHRAGWFPVPQVTYNIIGRKSPFFCMTYFPVVIRVDHLPLIREHIRKHLNKTTFDQAFFEVISRKTYSQFDIMCSYLWWYQKESYFWAIGQRNPSWKGPIPPGQVSSIEEAGITLEDIRNHGPRIAVHYSVTTGVIRLGACYAINHCCGNITRKSTLNRNEWLFESYNLSHYPQHDLRMHIERIERNDLVPIDKRQLQQLEKYCD